MKKFFDWFRKADSMVLKVLPCAWVFALFMGGADLFQDGVNLNAVLMFLLFLFCGLLFWTFAAALPWLIQDKEKPLVSNGLLLVVEAFVLVGLTMWAGGYV